MALGVASRLIVTRAHSTAWEPFAFVAQLAGFRKGFEQVSGEGMEGSLDVLQRGWTLLLGVDHPTVCDMLDGIDDLCHKIGHVMTRSEGKACGAADRIEVAYGRLDGRPHPSLARRENVAGFDAGFRSEIHAFWGTPVPRIMPRVDSSLGYLEPA